MTAEVAIMNKEAVALAADSAATFGDRQGRKIFSSASKVYALSKYHPVGIMIYSKASFMGVPWETVIKIYRIYLGTRELDKLKDYANDFFKFLASKESMIPDKRRTEFVRSHIHIYFLNIKTEINRKIDKELKEKKLIIDDVKKIVDTIINRHYQLWNNAKILSTVSSNQITEFKKKYTNYIKKAKKDVFEKLPISPFNHKKLNELAVFLLIKIPERITYSGFSGIVFAGFGKKELFPSVQSYSIEGLTNNFLKYKYDENYSNSIRFDMGAAIMPFAQREMVHTFMEGIDPSLEMEINNFLVTFFNNFPEIIVNSIGPNKKETKEAIKAKLNKISKETLKMYKERMQIYRREKFWSPIIQVTTNMTKIELALMAEALVNLTSLKRRVTMEAETVGGPIDVAVISKGDGFVWIKRKKYFDKDLNIRYYSNYFLEEKNAKKK